MSLVAIFKSVGLFKKEIHLWVFFFPSQFNKLGQIEISSCNTLPFKSEMSFQDNFLGVYSNKTIMNTF